MSVHTCNGRHRVCDKSLKDCIERVLPEPFGSLRMFEIETVGIELLDGGCGDDNAHGIALLDNVKSQKKGLKEGGRETIVWWRVESQDIDIWKRTRAHYGARWCFGLFERLVKNRDCKEGCRHVCSGR